MYKVNRSQQSLSWIENFYKSAKNKPRSNKTLVKWKSKGLKLETEDMEERRQRNGIGGKGYHIEGKKKQKYTHLLWGLRFSRGLRDSRGASVSYWRPQRVYPGPTPGRILSVRAFFPRERQTRQKKSTHTHLQTNIFIK